IAVAENEGWTRELIASAVRNGGGGQKLQDFIAAHPEHDPSKPPPVLPDYYQSLVLVGGQVFLRRPSIRGGLQIIGTGNKPRAMAITGQPVTGKTYSRDFISFVVENDPDQKRQQQKIVYVDLDATPPDPVVIAKRIGKKLGLKEEEFDGQGEQEARHLSDLIETLSDAATNHAAQVVWIMLDRSSMKQSSETDDFMTALIRAANRTPKLRVVLLNYKLPDLIAPFALKEEIDPVPFNDEHMKQFIKSVYLGTGKPDDAVAEPEDAAAEAAVTSALNEVLQQVDQQLAREPEHKDRRIEYLSAGLAIAAQRLSG